jgi:energy-coupling factor transporter ATP-binding protein EcfA2
MLHAACGRLGCQSGERRFLLIGDSGTGKTTLILQLAALGVAVEGDELAVVMPGGVAALPRRFHVKSTSLTELPWLPPGSERQPFYENYPGSYVFAVSPRALGYDWEIRHGAIDAVFYLEANHGGQPRLEELARTRMVELAMQQLRLPDARDRSWLAPLCTALDHATAHRLIVGRLDKTAELLVRKLTA